VELLDIAEAIDLDVHAVMDALIATPKASQK